MKNIVKGFVGKLSLKDRIIFESDGDYCDNTKSLFEYMIKQGVNNKYQMIWLVEHPENFENKSNIKFVNINEKNFFKKMVYYYYLATAKYGFYSHRNPLFNLNKNQVFVNLWHGNGPKNPKFLNLGHNFDYVLYSGEYFKPLFVDHLKCREEQMLPLGFPRNDLLFMDSHVLNKIQDKKYKKTIMWMPTFRKHKNGHVEFEKDEKYIYGVPILREAEQLLKLNNRLESMDIQLIIKLHPMQDMTHIELHPLSNIVFMTNNILKKHDIELYMLLSEMDALVTDYSSVYVDFMLLDKPIGFTIDDADDYKTGFAFDNILEYMPGHHMSDLNSLISFFQDMLDEKDPYSEDRARLMEGMNFYKSDFSKRILKYFKIN